MENSHTLNSLIQQVNNELKQVYPDREINSLIEIMLNHVVKLKKTDLLKNTSQTINNQHVKEIKDITNQLKQHKPIQQILGKTEFYDLSLTVTPDILIPRQETEELVDWILNETTMGEQKILDIGTGSGCIAIALAKHLPEAQVTALDYKQEILNVARENARLNGVSIWPAIADILKEDLPSYQYDLIVSNPPYVRESEKKYMHPNVLDHEPAEALFVDDADPLIFYRRIAKMGRNHLPQNGTLYFEINESLGEDIRKLLKVLGYKHIAIKKDINGKDRMIKAEI